jgi:ABC-type dipeptide/oligopeptide/nickel transport system ATPase component
MARATLDLVGLIGESGAADRLPFELSGGQTAAGGDRHGRGAGAPLLIADEPTSALDAGAQVQVLLLLQELVRTRNMGLILVSHDLAVVGAGDGSRGGHAAG